MRSSDWSSDVCSSDLICGPRRGAGADEGRAGDGSRHGGQRAGSGRRHCLSAVVGAHRPPLIGPATLSWSGSHPWGGTEPMIGPNQGVCMPSNLTVVVLAAGGGTRMKSKTMKVLHEVGGRSMIGHVLNAVRAMEPERVIAVIGTQREQVGPHISEQMPEAVLDRQRTRLHSSH